MDNLIFSILIKPSDHISNKKQKYFNREKDLTNIKTVDQINDLVAKGLTQKWG